MTVVTAILSAIAALAGPFAAMLTSLYNDIEGFFGSSDTTPDQLAAEALDLATKAAALVADVKAQIAIVTQALQESHSDLSVTAATHLATAAVAHAPVAAATPAK